MFENTKGKQFSPDSATDYLPDLASLQSAFVNIERFDMQKGSGRIRFRDQLLIKRGKIKLKIYQEQGHLRPHFHVDYGAQTHVASYAIDNGERLDGNLHKKFDGEVSSWATINRTSLLNIWSTLQAGYDVQPYIKALPAL